MSRATRCAVAAEVILGAIVGAAAALLANVIQDATPILVVWSMVVGRLSSTLLYERWLDRTDPCRRRSRPPLRLLGSKIGRRRVGPHDLG